MSMIEQLDEIGRAAEGRVLMAPSLAELAALESELLGKKSALSALKRGMGAPTRAPMRAPHSPAQTRPRLMPIWMSRTKLSSGGGWRSSSAAATARRLSSSWAKGAPKLA